MLEMTTARSAIKILRRFIIFAPYHHFAFLISNFSFKRSFHSQLSGSTPHELTPFPHLILVTLTRPVYIATVICCLCFPSMVISCREYRDLSIDPAKPSFLNNTCIRPEQ